MSRSELTKVARGWRWGRPAPRPYGAPGPAVRDEAQFDTEWARSDRANLARAVIQETLILPAVRYLASPGITGRERLRGVPQPAIVAANHTSHLDTSIVIEALPPGWRHRLAVGAAADYFFRDRLRGNLAALAMNAFPIERTRASVTSARLAIRLLQEGWNVILFPEGGRSEDGWLGELKPGAAFCAVRTGRPVVPMWIEGAEHLLPKGSNRPRRGEVRVLIGDALRPLPGEGARDLHSRLEEALRRLGTESSRDWWTALRDEGAGVHGPDAGRWRRIWAREAAPPRQESRWP